MTTGAKATVLVAEIGSTVTKVHAFTDLETALPIWLGSGMACTTVLQGDVNVGLQTALRRLEARLGGRLDYDRMMAASSAAGGLRMTVHGLACDMTVRAAREAALGAGAILKLVTSGRMGVPDIQELRTAAPGIILLAGGVEGGDREVAIQNASAVATSGVKAPVVYAGNTDARPEVVDVLEGAGLKVTVVPNVYPRLDQLDLEPCRRAIQAVFEEHIVAAPGMERMREMVGGPIRPTPGAVMEAAAALGGMLGDLVVVDVGGATTDVHSVTEGSAEIKHILLQPEPKAKRTVEGDLGIHVNARNIVHLAGEEEVAGYVRELAGDGGSGVGDTMDAREVQGLLARLVPLSAEDPQPRMVLFVEALARIAAETALLRHAGRLRYLFGPTGRVTIAEGKDLTGVEWVIGTGGPLTRFPHARQTLSRLAGLTPGPVEARNRRTESGGGLSSRPAAVPGSYLLPGRGARPLLDTDYVLAALGVLHHEYPEAAAGLLRRKFVGGAGHGE